MGKLNRFFATSTTLAEGSFWRRCLPTPPSLPRFASCPPCAAGGRGQERCPRSTGGTRGAGLCATGGWRWMPGKRQRGERARIQQGLEKRCQLRQTMPKNPTGKASAHAQRGDARWKAAPPPGNRPRAMPGKGRLGAAALLQPRARCTCRGEMSEPGCSSDSHSQERAEGAGERA